jgi:long-subunit fatty acid transport protein
MCSKVSTFLTALTLFTLNGVSMPSAEAGAYWLLDQATSNYGRGGASLVQPGDATGVYINPSALAGLEGLNIIIGANAINDNRSFSRAPNDLDGDGQADDIDDDQNPDIFETENNIAGPFPSPHAFIAYNFASLGLPNLSIGTGIWGPPRADLVMDKRGPQRYSTIASYNVQVHYALSAAYELPWNRLRFGFSAMGISQVINTELALNVPTACAGRLEDVTCDIRVGIVSEQHAIPMGTLAMSMELVKGLSFMASYRLPYSFNTSGEATSEVAFGVSDLVFLEGKDIKVNADMPGIVKTAFRYSTDIWNAELAGTWENWSVHQEVIFDASQIVVKPNPGITVPGIDPDLGQSIGIITLTPKLRDTFSLRVGGEYQVMEDVLTLRAGTYFESGAAEAKILNMGNYDSSKLGLTVGGKISVPGGLWIDFAAGYVHYFPIEVTESETVFDDPLKEEVGHPIGNGTYTNQQIIMMAALGGQWGL